MGIESDSWRLSDEERLERKKLESKLKSKGNLDTIDMSRLVELREKRRRMNEQGEIAKSKYLQGMKWHDETERNNNLPSNAGNSRDPNGELEEQGEDSIEETLEGFHFEGLRDADNRGVVKESALRTESTHSSAYEYSDEEVLPIENDPDEDPFEQLNTIESKEIIGIVNVEFNPYYIIDPSKRAGLENLGTVRIGEIWAEAKTVNLSKSGEEVMINISTGDKGFIFMALDDFFRMATIPQEDGSSVRLETPKINNGSEGSVRELNILLERFRVNGKYLGEDRPHEGKFVPRIRYTGEKRTKR